MKTLILYATKHGAARETAERIALYIEGAEVFDLKEERIPDIGGFECVIIGSSVYAGMIRGEAKSFMEREAGRLAGKRLGLFVCGLGTSREKEVFESNFPEALLRQAKTATHVGGIYDPEKVGFFERFIMKMVTKQTEYVNTLDDGKIKEFAEDMTADGDI